MKLELGKYYKTRDGRKVGPLEKHDSENYPFVCDIEPNEKCSTHRAIWDEFGNNFSNIYLDLVEQCPGETLNEMDVSPGDKIRWHGSVFTVQKTPDRNGKKKKWATMDDCSDGTWISGDAEDCEVIKPAQNPKQAFGDKKPSLGLVPLAAEIEETLALMDGANKYGEFNWRENPVEAMTYVHAAIRHLKLWASGDERTRDTDIHNLGAVKACCSILMDAQTNGTMIDNRSKSPETCDKLHDAEKNVSFLKERLTKK